MASKPSANEVKNVSLELVEKPPRRGRGRPITLTLRVFVKVCRHIERGFSIPASCEFELVSYRRFRERVAQSSRLTERLKAAEETRFNLRREEALASVMSWGEKSWMAHAWFLERCFPSEFALKAVQRDTGDLEQQPLLNKISLQELTENARLATEIANSPPPGLPAKELTNEGSEQCA